MQEEMGHQEKELTRIAKMQYSTDSQLRPTFERDDLRLDLVTPLSTAGKAAVRPKFL
jgi:hypothetical protein